ncbi:MAG: DMT family transporter [Acidimicrobiaceae bacterium]|nr:DMT family transporter [Acidimicrobiaceae bacterium]
MTGGGGGGKRGRRLGAVMMLASGLGFGATGAISRSIEADVWQIASWRSGIGGGAVLVYVWLRSRVAGSQDGLRWSATLGPQGLLLAGLSALSMILYIDALQRTEVANVTVIWATVPFLAAGLAWLILREPLRRSTVVAAVVALAGVTLTVAGNLGPGDLDGNMRAVLLAITLALLIVLIRRFEGADAVLALGSAGVLLFLVALVVADPLGVDRDQMPLLVFFGAVFAVSLVLWTEGVRLIPAAEAGLLASSETPFSILLAWIVLAEAPPLVTVAGGLLVMGAIFGHAGADLAAGRVSRPWMRPRTRPRL